MSKTAAIVGTALALLLGGGGVAWAARRSRLAPGKEPPYFLYTVQAGDTLSDLAKRFFGDAQKSYLFGGLDKVTAPESLPIGAQIQVPCTWTTVEPGDSLAVIAKRTLGDGTRWRRIYEANKKALPDPNQLGVGQRLAVPTASQPDMQAFKDHYDQGMQLYQQSLFAESIREFHAAYAIRPFPRILYNLGRAHFQLGHGKEAIDLLTQYLKQEPDAPPEMLTKARETVAQAQASLTAAHLGDLDLLGADYVGCDS